MYSPKYVDYVDKKRIESAFYNPKSKPKTWVGVIPKTPETRMNTGFFARQNGSWYWIDTNFSNPALRENDSKMTSKTVLLNDKFSRTVLLVLFLFQGIYSLRSLLSSQVTAWFRCPRFCVMKCRITSKACTPCSQPTASLPSQNPISTEKWTEVQKRRVSSASESMTYDIHTFLFWLIWDLRHWQSQIG